MPMRFTVPCFEDYQLFFSSVGHFSDNCCCFLFLGVGDINDNKTIKIIYFSDSPCFGTRLLNKGPGCKNEMEEQL